MGLEPTSLSTGGFQNRFLTNSGDLHCQACLAKAPGTGIEPATFWFRARRNYQQLLPRVSKTDRAMFALVRQARGRGFEPLSPDSKSGSLPLADPRIRSVKSAMRESNPPVQLGRLAPLPIGQWHMFRYKRKERGSNSQSSVSARPLSRRLPSPSGLPFHCQHRQQESNLRRVSS